MIVDRIQKHFDAMLATGLVPNTAMWMSSLDVHTGCYPVDDSHPESIGKRVYRNIDAPGGCSLYWDQPMIVTAYALSRITENDRYGNAARAYIEDFLRLCVAETGIFLWGNHYYYDFEKGCTVGFHSNEEPSPDYEFMRTGVLHEIRPISPAWESFWEVDPAACERAIRSAVNGHLVDRRTGEFQRHAEGETGCAFLEAGGILIEALAWLWTKTGDDELLALADLMVLYSWRNRNHDTGLLENNPTWDRWDKRCSTTEAGLWAHCLIRAARYCDRKEWVDIAKETVKSWLHYGFDETSQRFYGRLDVATGEPIIEPKTTVYQPGDYADLWEPLFPAHDYPMAFAEACISLYELTGDAVFAEGCDRWRQHIQVSTPARNGQGGYAEHYGRCIHFLKRAGDGLGDPAYHDLAKVLVEEAFAVLDLGEDLLLSHPGEERCDAVDGLGWLFLALLYWETGEDSDTLALGW